jgi:hypothetical protein
MWKRLESKDMAKKERCNNLEGDCIAWVAARAGVVGESCVTLLLLLWTALLDLPPA